MHGSEEPGSPAAAHVGRVLGGAAVGLAAALLLAGPAEASPEAVTAGDLAGLQPAPAAIDGIVAGPGMRKPALAVTYHSQALQVSTSTAPQCTSAVHLGDNEVYGSSPYRGIDLQILTSDTTGPVRARVTTTIAAFPTADAALTFVSEIGQTWQGCDGAEVNVSYADEPDEKWYVRQLAPVGDGYSVRTNRVEDHSSCSHVITAKSNAVVEAMVCTSGIISDQAVRVADQITAGIAD